MPNQEIYIIDDTADYRFLLEQVFARFLSQYTVRFFTGGDALNEYRQQPDLSRPDPSRPALIILDLKMPGLSGYQTLVQLKQSPWQAIPVVMMSNDGSGREIEQCYEAGANSFLTKPIDLDSTRQLMTDICRYWLELNQLPGATNPV